MMIQVLRVFMEAALDGGVLRALLPELLLSGSAAALGWRRVATVCMSATAMLLRSRMLSGHDRVCAKPHTNPAVRKCAALGDQGMSRTTSFERLLSIPFLDTAVITK